MGSSERIAILHKLLEQPVAVWVDDSVLAADLGLELEAVREQLQILELTGRVQLRKVPSGVTALITAGGRQSLAAIAPPSPAPAKGPPGPHKKPPGNAGR